MSEPNTPTISTLIERRHTKAVAWREVKDGPTWNGAPRRIDLLALERTWTPITIWAYEIKASRSDWVRDQKLREYEGLATHFAVVAEAGVVRDGELPDGWGLLERTKSGRALRTVRKAARKDLDWERFGHQAIYLLMSRVTPDSISERSGVSRETRVTQWRAALEARDAARVVGRMAAGKIGEQLRASAHAQALAARCAALDAWLVKHGTQQYGSLEEALDRVVLGREREIEAARANLEAAAKRVAGLLNVEVPK